MKVKIKPITKTIDTMEIVNISVSIKSGNPTIAQVLVKLSGDINETKMIDLTPEEYSLWGDNDEYILSVILTRLNLELQ
jgi:hypothetical protein